MLALQGELLRFEALTTKSLEAAKKCDKLQVNCETTKAIVIQNLSLLKEKMKEVEEIHKSAKQPYWDECKKIDGLKNALYNPMEVSFKAATKRVLDYDQSQREKELIEEVSESNSPAFAYIQTKGIRKTWTFEVVDEKLIPENWKCLNKKAIKDFMSGNKESLKDGEIIGGVKFYQTESLTIR